MPVSFSNASTKGVRGSSAHVPIRKLISAFALVTMLLNKNIVHRLANIFFILSSQIIS